MKVKVLVSSSSFGAGGARAVRLLAGRGIDLIHNPYGRRLKEDELIALARDGVRGLLAGTEPLTGEVFTALPALRVISRIGTGMDNVDMAAAKRMGFLVYNTPDATTDGVAELALGLMLVLLRKIAIADTRIRKGEWKPIMGNLLGARTVGIIGYGRIGRRIGHVLTSGFGATVIFYDPFIQSTLESEKGARQCATLEELLENADIVTLHLPGNKYGRPFIGVGEMARMKEGALIINVARGGLVDENALLEALNAGRLGGAGLDVYAREPYSGPLTGSEKVVLTMHMGSYAEETRARMELEAVENLISGLQAAGLIS